ncbi:MAG: transaldolase [Alphaproteobacteria bacterium TMED62]|nr:MAG: transaldolase [Alphaproteobacteria bacterium TMED62]|tara:strand:- start:7180 stop:7902 length:723 start_codon:yes stop_codon:yes gene_type:complete
MKAVSLSELNLKIFADGADINKIKIFANNPLIKGFTTNPTLMKKNGINNYETFSRDVLDIVQDKPISFEVFADDSEEIVKQAKFISSWGSNVFVKVPVTNTKGVFLGSVIEKLSKEGIKLNITAVFTIEQVKKIISSLDNHTSTIISIFAGRIADSGIDPVKYFIKCKENLDVHQKVELLWASPRELYNIYHAEEAGADIITISEDLINKFQNIGKDLDQYSKETVEMFYNDALMAGYKL